jgi:hypothetical protein
MGERFHTIRALMVINFSFGGGCVYTFLYFKETAGESLDNPKLEAEGTAEKIVGKVQEKTGQIKKVFGK